MATSKTSSTPPIIDDHPCWGGPEPHRHNLEYLLRVLGGLTSDDDDGASDNIIFSSHEEYVSFIQQIHNKLIIHQDENYIAINKPADLRMDGPYRATLHKLLLYLFPPPSLEQQIISNNEEDDNDNKKCSTSEGVDFKNHEKLLQLIAPLSSRAFCKDDPFRMVHQLDYATSGVVLLGKSKKSTAAACKSFDQRKTNKQYVAVVTNYASSQSDKSPLDREFIKFLPTLPSSALEPWKDGSLEKKYRKKRQRDSTTNDHGSDKRGKRATKTFDGYMPIHSVFDKWRASLVKEQKEYKKSSKNKRSNMSELRRDRHKKQQKVQLPPLPDKYIYGCFASSDEILSLGRSWKVVKTKLSSDENNLRYKYWMDMVETMTKEYNDILEQHCAKVAADDKEESNEKGDVEKKTASAEPGSTSLPPLFRIQDDNNDSSDHEDTFYICASIGECKDQFQVVVDPAAVQKDSNNVPTPPDPLPELKPSLTKCTVLWRGQTKTNNGQIIPVTKVLLKPWTGRRHQLRVHMAYIAGYPILGDATYSSPSSDQSSEPSNGKVDAMVEHQRVFRKMCRRMCLHAKELTIPLLGNEEKTFVANDPFVVKKDDCSEEEALVVIM